MTKFCIVDGQGRLILLILLQSMSVEVSSLINDGCEKTRTIAHLLPSNANLGGFFPMSAWGFAGLAGFFGADDKTECISNNAQ